MKLQKRENTHKDLLFVLLFIVIGISILMGVSSNVESGLSDSEIIIPVGNNIGIQKISYYSEYDSCHYEGCPMKSGNRAYIGAVACPTEYPLFTEISINGIKYICEDRTASWVGDRFDIFTGFGQEAHDLAWNNGIDYLEVIIY